MNFYQIDEKFSQLFPNINVFKLSKDDEEEIEFDPFASLFSFFIENKEKKSPFTKDLTCEEEKEIYNLPSYLETINFLASKKKTSDFLYTKYLQEKYNIEILEYFQTKLFNSLREICAILANTTENCQIGYKGNKEDLNNILSNLDEVFKKPHCKISSPENDTYSNLVEQIIKWGLDNSLLVLEGLTILFKNFLKE